jgi:protein transport protein SEC61 subunit gamma and related proteins
MKIFKKIKEFLISSKRILSISTKPSKKEFWTMSKVIGLGMVIIGIIGFLVKLIMEFIL